jgi:large subunit ribosomal protein L9
MPKTEVILTSNLVGLGAESDHVKVAAGFARNYLFPRGLAIPLTGANKRRLEALQQRRAEREAHELNTMSELGSSLGKMIIKISVKTGADGKMFGAVTAGTIADELKNQCDVVLDKKKIHLELPIRTLGDHDVELRLHPNVTSTLKVKVESSMPAEIPLVPPTGAGKAPAAAETKGGRPGREPRAGGADKGGPREAKGVPEDRGRRESRYQRPRPAKPAENQPKSTPSA